MKTGEIHNCAELIDLIGQIGFLPLLDSGIRGYSAEEIVDDDCRYVVLPDGGWDWPLWKWKGEIITEGGHVYGKFFAGKAGFISREWWPDFCNYRRRATLLPSHARPEATLLPSLARPEGTLDPSRTGEGPGEGLGTIEDTILLTLAEHRSLITRELRALCGFDGPKMRSRFDSYVTRLQMATRIVTEDFVYPQDRHGRQYGWGWSLLTTPEQLYGRDACRCDRTPDESFARICEHIRKICPEATEAQIRKMIK